MMVKTPIKMASPASINLDIKRIRKLVAYQVDKIRDEDPVLAKKNRSGAL